jgi:hypothetical protein
LDPAADLEALAAKAGLEDDLLDPLRLSSSLSSHGRRLVTARRQPHRELMCTDLVAIYIQAVMAEDSVDSPIGVVECCAL